MLTKMCKLGGLKRGLRGGHFEIAGLRHFYHGGIYWVFFWHFCCMALWRSLGVSWAALGFLEGLLGGLWTQKH